ncbi:hypothetical protein VM1G_08077 [Cytospora mali]|uniref:F-box domain-containing protein n=1 Tax=Cytospora mali TaxID=578113 RepID=A0A194W5R6_CYTMA|nr:hypothetical protein VM1G_08077 [Valsa mali]
MAFNIIEELSKTPDIFEVVFLHLPQRDLLHAQRVSRHWSDFIAQSPALQQKLFLKPISTAEASRRKPEFNPLVKELFPFLFKPQPFPGPNENRYTIERATEHWAKDQRRRDAILRPEASWRRMLPVQPAARIDGVLNHEWCCVGSVDLEWCEVDASKYVQIPGKPAPHATDNAGKAGLDLEACATMGLLYDIVFHRLDDFANTEIYVQWHMCPESYAPWRPSWVKSDDEEGCAAWADFDTNFSDPESRPTRPENMKPRDEITVHSSFYGSWHQDEPAPTGLKVLDVPEGLVLEGDEAQHYENGMRSHEYSVWGRLPPGMKSDEELDEI